MRNEDQTKYLRGEIGYARYLSTTIDNLLALFISVVISGILNDFLSPVIIACLTVFNFLAYFIIQEAVWSKTIGKKIVGLTVVNEFGENINFKQAILRNITRIIEANPLFGFIIGIVVTILTENRQRIGDLLANTTVVKYYPPLESEFRGNKISLE